MSIEQLLKEFDDDKYTRQQFDADRARLITRLCEKHEISEDEVDALIAEHRYFHSAEDPEDEYIQVMVMGRYTGWVP